MAGWGGGRGRQGRQGWVIPSHQERRDIDVGCTTDTERARHIFSLNGFSDIREEVSAPQRGSVVGSTACSIHRSLLQGFAANLLRDAEAPWHLKGSGQAAELGSSHQPLYFRR